MGTAPTVEMSSLTGWLAIGVVGLAAGTAAVLGTEETGIATVVWWLVYALYALAFWLSDPRPGVWSRIGPPVALGVLVVSGIALLLIPSPGWTPVLLVVTTVVAAFDFDRAVVTAVVGVQTSAIAVAAATDGQPVDAVVFSTLTYGVFQVFAAIIVRVARRENEARAALAEAHAELRATTRLLDLSSRNAERLRISRDLHDMLGHKLTALALALEVAHHQMEGPALDQVTRARAIAKDLLTDVRDTVSTLRETPTPLEPALRELVDDLPQLDVDLAVDERVPLSSERYLVVVRCIQELATNALRHGRATRLRVEVTSDEDGLRVTAEDDGQGADAWRPGNGLTGMRERFDDLGGTVEFSSSRGAGFRLAAEVPA